MLHSFDKSADSIRSELIKITRRHKFGQARQRTVQPRSLFKNFFFMQRLIYILIFFGSCGLIFGFHPFKKSNQKSSIPFVYAVKKNLDVQIKTIGELDAIRSTVIASSVKGDQGKIIDLIADGIYVQKGQVLVKMDGTPFEEKVEKLRMQLKEQESYLAALEQTLEWEKLQAEHKNRTASYEIESAQLELDKLIYGDGPQENSRLKGALHKAKMKYEELCAYSEDIIELEKQGFINATEVKQAQKKLYEEEEAYEIAKLQYESYIQHVYPMQVKKAETCLKRAQVNAEEVAQNGLYNVAKALNQLDQARQGFEELSLQLKEAEKELSLTEIRAPAPGMVVHREDFRAGQRRKPRIGDILVKNQPLMDLPDFTSMSVKTQVRECDLYKVAVGAKATIEVDAYPQFSFDGVVNAIGVLAMKDCGKNGEEKHFDVIITLNDSQTCLRPGMTARVTIHAQKAQEILAIPLHAIFGEDKHYYCYVASPQGYEKRDTLLGINNDQWVEVKEGLKEGEKVCLLNPYL